MQNIQNIQNRQIILARKRTKYTKYTHYTIVAYNVQIMQSRLIILKLDNSIIQIIEIKIIHILYKERIDHSIV